MQIFQVLDAWLSAKKNDFDANGITARLDHSPLDRPFKSRCLNLRCDLREADLVVWESGEAELVFGTIDALVTHTHFESLRNANDLSIVLSKLSEFIIRGQAD